jgi:hypothetical protein
MNTNSRRSRQGAVVVGRSELLPDETMPPEIGRIESKSVAGAWLASGGSVP